MTEESLLTRIRNWINTGVGRWVAIGLAAVVIVVAVVALVFGGGSGARVQEIRGRGRRVLYICKACGATGETRIAYETKFPIGCPTCGKNVAALAFKCVKCGKIIESVQAPYFRCPHCRHIYDNRLAPSAPGGGT